MRKRLHQKRKQEIAEKMLAVLDYKVTMGCCLCPEGSPAKHHPGCLDLHHRDKRKKVKPVSHLIKENADWDIIWEEVRKCDVMCSNCHRMKHWDELHKTVSIENEFLN
jgi:hypothetical protein